MHVISRRILFFIVQNVQIRDEKQTIFLSYIQNRGNIRDGDDNKSDIV